MKYHRVIGVAAVAAVAVTLTYVALNERLSVPVGATVKSVTATDISVPFGPEPVRVAVVPRAPASTAEDKAAISDRVHRFTQVVDGMGFSGDIRLLAKQNPQLGLTPDQISQIQQYYDDVQIERLAIEGSLAKVASVDDDQVRIVVPAYPEEGERLRANFYQRLDRLLGPALGQTVHDAWANRIANAMRSFGANVQEITARREISGTLDIEHRIAAADGSIKTVNSRLNPRHLDQYVAFADQLAAHPSPHSP